MWFSQFDCIYMKSTILFAVKTIYFNKMSTGFARLQFEVLNLA